MIKTSLEGLVLGLTIGGYCTAFCSPFIFPYLLTGPRATLRHKIFIFTEFTLGRLAAYLVFAAATVLLGRSLQNILTPRIKGTLLILAALVVLIYSVWCLFREQACNACLHTRVSLKSLPWLTGFFLGINLCPPFALALVQAISIKDLVPTALYFISLFIGTTLYLTPAPFIINLLPQQTFKRVGAYLGVLTGIWFTLQGVISVL